MARVLVAGVAVADFVFALDALPTTPEKYKARDADIMIGGCAANAAIAIARLGGDAMLAARLGDDLVADLIASSLAGEGVDARLLQRTAHARTSFSSVFVDAAGERQIVNYRGAGLTEATDWLATDEPVAAVLADNRWPALAEAAMALAADRSVPGIIDAEPGTDLACLRAATHVAFSRPGLKALTGHAAIETGLRAAHGLVPGWIAVTDGANGVYVVANDGAIAHVPGYTVDVRDTLAAGDVWHGAFALRLGEGTDELEAARFANAVAAIKCTQFGGVKGTPGRLAVDQLIEEQG
ncbi:MAG: PfkB family carbohydrate kinase [Pseudomonadota bacterium]